MTWNHDISTAPRGKTVSTERKGKGDKMIVSHEFITETVWLVTKCGKVLRSHLVADGSRWVGLATGEQPIAWQPYVIPAYPRPRI